MKNSINSPHQPINSPHQPINSPHQPTNSTPHDLNPSFLQKLALDLVRSRKSNYLEDSIYYHSQDNKFIIQDLPHIKNIYNHLLKVTLIKHRLTLLEIVQQDFIANKKHPSTNNQKCIIYLHGLGSNRIEGFSLLPHLPKNYSLLTFDLSGSGKSQGDFTTYGYREKQDIQSILLYLHQHHHIQEFIIWGRSMGAVASLLFNNILHDKQKYSQNSHPNTPQENKLAAVFKCVKCIVADSPFSSFSQISKDIALKKMSIPNFFTQIALKFLQNSFEKLLFDPQLNKSFTPFQIDFTKNPLKPAVPIIFIYSLNDQIVNCDHSQKIINAVDKARTKLIEKVIIPDCGHNLKRPQNVFQIIFQKIQKNCQPPKDYVQQIDSYRQKNHFQSTEVDSQIHKHKKGIRNKSFWNFQEQFSQNVEPVVQQSIIFPSQSEPEPNSRNKFAPSKEKNQPARRNIFDRDQKPQNSKMNTSITKKRGLSLSSTIQRCQNLGKQSKINFESTIKVKNLKESSRIEKGTHLAEQKSFVRLMSVQQKTSNVISNEESQSGSPKKGLEIAKFNAQIMSENFSKSTKNRPSLGGNKPRISLGGSVQKRSKPTFELFKTSAHSKIIAQKNYYSQMAPERDSSNPNTFSTISYSDQTMYSSAGTNKNFQTITLNRQGKLGKKILEEHFQSEPNILKEEEFDLRRISSRQSINTIDEGQLDESLSSFINTKLQFGLDSYSQVATGFNKFKTISPTSGTNKCKQSLILSQIDIKQVTEMAQNSNKLSTIAMPSHISLRPSSRLYHEKRKKKLQAHSILINKQNENLKITNDRYLNDD